jgi:hypothetical protein
MDNSAFLKAVKTMQDMTAKARGEKAALMLWILQQNFYSEPNYEKLVETLPRMGLPTLRIKPVPFTHQLLPYDYDTSKASDLSQVPAGLQDR